MTQRHTHQTIHDLIQAGWESDLPDRVLAALRPLEGKPITTRLLSKLPPVPNGWRLIRHYGWTSLQTADYGTQAGYAGGHSLDLMLARSEASVPLDLAWVERENSAYFDARRSRDHARMEAMNDKTALDRLVNTLNRTEAAIVELRECQKAVEFLTGYGTIFAPDSYRIARACGLSDTDGRPILSRDYKGQK